MAYTVERSQKWCTSPQWLGLMWGARNGGSGRPMSVGGGLLVIKLELGMVRSLKVACDSTWWLRVSGSAGNGARLHQDREQGCAAVSEATRTAPCCPNISGCLEIDRITFSISAHSHAWFVTYQHGDTEQDITLPRFILDFGVNSLFLSLGNADIWAQALAREHKIIQSFTNINIA